MSDLKNQRGVVGMTQHDLAERMGVSQSLVAQWETGRRDPNAAQAVLLSQVLSGAALEEPRAAAYALPRPRKSYPAAPTEPQARRVWVDARNEAIRNGGKEMFNPSGTEGKGIPRPEKKKRGRG